MGNREKFNKTSCTTKQKHVDRLHEGRRVFGGRSTGERGAERKRKQARLVYFLTCPARACAQRHGPTPFLMQHLAAIVQTVVINHHLLDVSPPPHVPLSAHNETTQCLSLQGDVSRCTTCTRVVFSWACNVGGQVPALHSTAPAAKHTLFLGGEEG